MKNLPFVSICLATYNRYNDLVNCLDSLTSQDYSKDRYEIIVVEDGSHSGAKDHIQKLIAKSQKPKAVHYYWQKNEGPASARNLAIKHAKGEIIAFCDDDTVPPKNWLFALVKGFKDNPDVAAVGGFQEESEAELKRNPFARYESYITHQLYGAGDKSIKGGFEVPTGGTNNVAYKKSILDQYGTFDTYFNAVFVKCSLLSICLKWAGLCGKSMIISGEDPDLKKRITDAGEKFLYLPLKVEHKRKFTLKGLAKQSWSRGLGIIHFAKKHKDQHMPTKIELYIQLIKLPLATIKAFFVLRDKALVFPQLIDRLFTIKGQLDYDKVVVR